MPPNVCYVIHNHIPVCTLNCFSLTPSHTNMGHALYSLCLFSVYFIHGFVRDMHYDIIVGTRVHGMGTHSDGEDDCRDNWKKWMGWGVLTTQL